VELVSLAKALAERGYDLVVASAGVRLDAASQQIAAAGVRVLPVQADLATPKGIEELWAQVQSIGHDLDIACINAGVGVGGPLQ
jgi:short-subunit dehydrogenase